MAIMLLTSGAAIVLTCSALILYELITTRDESVEQMATLARVVSANSTAALAFRDEQDAQEVLASLRAEPGVVAAVLYDEHGEPFASYLAAGIRGDLYPPGPGPDGYRFDTGRLEGFAPVSESPERRLGTLYIRADTRAVYARFWLWGAIAAAAMVASLLLAYFLSRIFQARISQGAELLSTFAPSEGWRVVASYAYINLDMQPRGGDLNRGVSLEGATPRQQFSLRSLLDLPGGLQFDAQFRHSTELERQPDIVVGPGIEAYSEVDLRLAWQASEQLEVSLVGQNLLHDHHVEFGPPAARGEIERSVYGKVTWQF